MIRTKRTKRLPVIDLDGPQGNAFYLMGVASQFSKALGFSKKRENALFSEMKSADYENLVKVFEREFGELVVLETSNKELLKKFKTQ